MHANRYLIPAILLVCLTFAGCSKSTNAPNNPGAQNNAATDNGGSNPNAPNSAYTGTPATDNAGTQAPEPLVIPAGTSITVRLQQGLSSRTAVAGERFDAVVDEPIVLDNRTVLPVGTPVTGHVVVARRSGRLHHPGELGLTLDSVYINNQEISLATSHIVARGKSHKKRNWGWIGGGTGGGALIGALAAGGKGALIGSGIGAAAGTTTAFITGRKDVAFGAERRLRFRLNRDISITA